ncbi:Integral membrane sensor signal transduction histidine kinase [Paenibacillus illinoisensis]|uniref:histidine kinase n=2 Tax=Paenibacillus illinoisensis TaxID=59845 RepID=A0A2W0CRW5_9BACL|nr:Integral membrane sensor signal transduction histidine kinase [Paenibacillus illinoisensis]
MLIMVASLALTGAAIFLGYVMAGALQKIEYAAVPINWIIEHAGSIRVMIVTGIVLFPVTFFLASLRLVRDLRETNAGLQQISAGQFGHVVTVKGKDELSVIAESMNQLSSEWDHYLTQITCGLEEIASGQFDHQIPEIAGNKLGEVARSINQMSMQLKHSIAEERKAEKTKNDLITGVSHDLRTPLTSILGFLEVIEKDRYQDEVEMRYFVNIAYEKSLSLRRLIDELFEYTRINNGLPLELSELDIAGLIGQLAEEFVPITENAGMEIRLNIQEGEFKTKADGGLLVRAYENIIANAIQYGRTGKYIDIDLTQDEGMLVVRIQNYGPPIPERDLPFIFDRFYRVENSRSKQTGGTGLGLAITKSIIEVHGGRITAYSSKKVTWFETRLSMFGPNQTQVAVMEEVHNEIKRKPTGLPEQGLAPKERTSPWFRRLSHSSIAAIPMILFLVCAVVLFSVKSSFTSNLVTKLPSIFSENDDLTLMSTSGNNEMTLITGKTDKGYTLVIQSYIFDGQSLIIQYSMKHSNQISESQWAKQSVKPTFMLDPSTIKAVPGIATDSGVVLAKNGTINYYFIETLPPPDQFLLKVNVNQLVLSDDSAQQDLLTGDWSFQIPVEKNYKRKANGQSEPL